MLILLTFRQPWSGLYRVWFLYLFLKFVALYTSGTFSRMFNQYIDVYLLLFVSPLIPLILSHQIPKVTTLPCQWKIYDYNTRRFPLASHANSIKFWMKIELTKQLFLLIKRTWQLLFWYTEMYTNCVRDILILCGLIDNTILDITIMRLYFMHLGFCAVWQATFFYLLFIY